MPGCFSPLEESHSSDLIDNVAKLLKLKPGGSLLCLGGGEWYFGQRIAVACGAEVYVYADEDQAMIKEADNEDILTSDIHWSDYSTIAQLGKYDGLILKNIFENGALDLQVFLEAIWKILKLNSNAVIMLRPEPRFPYPTPKRNQWASNVSAMDNLEELCKAEDATFAVEIKDKFFHVKLSKQDFKEGLRHFHLDDNQINTLLADIDQNVIEFDDQIKFIGLTKVID